MNNNLREEALSRALIAAHRGAASGNIPCNTIAAFDAALYQGADIIELDVVRSIDGKLFVFHGGMEKYHLYIDKALKDMTAEDIGRLVFCNQDGQPTANKISPLEDVLERLKGRCYINIDKFWTHMAPIYETVKRHGMVGQVLVKSLADEEIFKFMEQAAPDIPYMVMIYGKDEISADLGKRNMNYIGTEVHFTREDEELASGEYTEAMNKKGLMTWVDAIVYNQQAVLAAGHSDDVSITGNPESGWGWLLDRGYNIIQTDWPLALKIFMGNRKADGHAI